jgi:sulfate transport system ATP-binding protein
MSIALEHISKSFGAFRALEDINLTFPDGELTALLGPSGSGKTTLLRLVAGLEEADPNPASRLLFDGRDVAREPVGRRQVGFVFQHYALFRHLTVAENVAFGLRVKPRAERPSKREIADRVRELLSLVQLGSMADRLPSQLSGGQRQRVALARALAIQPRVLLLDEPFGALDAKVRAELRRWLRDLHDRLHITSLFVTHDQEEALEVADRIVVMSQGRVEQVGTPDEVFHRPASEFVLHFLGEVNVFHGRLGPSFADFSSPPAAAATEAGAVAARLLVRPHELDIRYRGDGSPGVAATVTRVLTAGPVVKVDLSDRLGRAIQVHLAHETYRQTPYAPGEEVVVIPRQPHVYAHHGEWVGDYVI